MISRDKWRLGLIPLSLVSLFFIPFFSSPAVFAYESSPTCLGKSITWQNFESSFEIVLNCENIISFSPTDLSQTLLTSENANIGKIELHSPTNKSDLLTISSPFKAEIISNELHLSFYSKNYFFNGSLQVRDIEIGAGVLFNSSGKSNDAIQVATAAISDTAAPHAEDDNYRLSGLSLEVSAENGLLANDQESEGVFCGATVTKGPDKGVISASRADGSFTYTPNDGYFGDDYFVYSTIDDSGNKSNEATVKISDAEAAISDIKFINLDASGDAGYAKLGDTLQLSFETNEPVTINEIQIAKNTIDVSQIISNNGTSFVAHYALKNTDVEGAISYSISAIDRAGNKSTPSTENGIIFDMTKPEILPDDNLTTCSDDDSIICLEINESYNEPSTITATDTAVNGTKSDLMVVAVGLVDIYNPGVYVVDYLAVDKAGNEDAFSRIIRVVDSVSEEYKMLSDNLALNKIETNLSSITTNNREHFSNLFFEKSINGQKIVRVTFNGPIDISVFELSNLVTQINDKLSSVKIGSVDLNLDDFSGLSSFINDGVIVKFYSLNLLGYSSATKTKDVVDRLNLTDEFGKKVNDVSHALSNEKFYGFAVDMADCYYFEIATMQLFKYDIDVDNIAPRLTINSLGAIESGETVVLSGTIDDSDAKLTLKIGDKLYDLMTSNVNGTNWSFAFSSSLLSLGDYQVQISAVDFAGNQSSVATSLHIKKTSKEASSSGDILSSMAEILSQTATIDGQVDQAVSSVHTIKQNARVIASAEDSGIFGLSWLKVLIIASALSLAGLVILAIIQKYLKRK